MPTIAPGTDAHDEFAVVLTSILDASDYGTIGRLLTSQVRTLFELDAAVLMLRDQVDDPLYLSTEPHEARRTVREFMDRIEPPGQDTANVAKPENWRVVSLDSGSRLHALVVDLPIGTDRFAQFVGWSTQDPDGQANASAERLYALSTAASHAFTQLQTRNALTIAQERAHVIERVSRDLSRARTTDDQSLIATRAMRHAARADGAVTYLFADMASPPNGMVGSGMDASLKPLLQLDTHSPHQIDVERRLLSVRDPLRFDIADVQADQLRPALADVLQNEAARHLVAIPMHQGDRLTGVTYLYRRERRSVFSDGDLDAAGAISAQLVQTTRHVETPDDTTKTLDRTRLMLDFARSLNREAEPKAIARLLDAAIRAEVPEADVSVSLNLDRRWTFLENGATGVLQSTREPGSTELLLSLVDSERHFGQVTITPPDGVELSAGQRSLIEAYISQTTTALNRSILATEAERHSADLNGLHRFSQIMSSRHDMRQTFDLIIAEIERMVECHAGAIHIANPENGTMQAIAIWGDIDNRSRGAEIPIDKSILGDVYRSGEPTIVSDVTLDPRAFDKAGASWRAQIAVPLTTAGTNYGTLFVGHREPGAYRERDQRLLNLIATQTASAIYQAHQDERLQTLYRSSVEALALAVDAKDAKTHAHSRRVATIGMRIGKTIGLDAQELERIELAGLLHDIGKIGIPDRILGKPQALDPEERVLMMSHATLGASILSSHPDLIDLAPLVRHHHERHDGHGYPDGLSADNVPIGAAILAVADAFETMTSDRPYRSAIPVSEARVELTAHRGSQFHPAVVDALLESIDSDDGLTREFTAAPQSSDVPAISPIQAEDVIGLRVLTRIAREIGRLSDGVQFLEHVEHIISAEFPSSHALIWLADDPDAEHNDETAVMMRRYSGRPPFIPPPSISAGELIQGEVIVDNEPGSRNRYLGLEASPTSAVLVPLILEENTLGVMELILSDSVRIDSYMTDLMTAIAGQLSPTIRLAMLHDNLRRAAVTDELTGAQNRRGFQQRIESWLRDPQAAEGLQVILVDVIGLKMLNDAHGHATGDVALQAISDALHERATARALVSRYGGDEFAVILPGPAEDSLQEITRRIEQPVSFVDQDGVVREIHLRCGAAAYRDPETVRDLVGRADARLYARIGPTPRTF